MIRQGSKVRWQWASGTASGKVIESWDHTVSKTIKGSQITRRGEPGNKALLIRQEDGDEVLKLESEVEKV
ncbi:hypervirulence associated TUDOR domain-containing protein [Cesiribacter andamanensis]|uniref:Hypervirulence associated protein TUDOR domain-containing protein n=1 Tax=Cesiribacter andamanensis AMV16 TaxID=1279009 RepID=M7NPN9_9BACT|nr:DUF2945 domain-containing protein [Cesiribacter andamanensis]EMR03680.1 hypothetical protein ADICEAN_01201 [Cesiribacter andamanensis AMV16]